MSNGRVKTWGAIASVAALLLLVGLVGNMDYQDEIAEESAYCRNVAEGIWPDYEGTYGEWCEEGRHTPDRRHRADEWRDGDE